jgi:hypothetical protein
MTIADGIRKHEEVLHDCFGGDIGTWGFHRRADDCSNPLAALQGESKGIEAKVDGVFSANTLQQLGASDWVCGMKLRDGEVDNLIE